MRGLCMPFGLMAAGSLIEPSGLCPTATLYVAAGLAMLMAIPCTGGGSMARAGGRVANAK